MSKNLRNIYNFLYFHRKRAAVTVGFSTSYGYLCYKGRTLNNEMLRMGVAGSVGNTFVECMFHFLDTINVRAKVSETSISSLTMVKHIYHGEGL